MLSSRLTFARAQGLPVLLGATRVCVFGARAGDDLGMLDAAVQVVQGMKPDGDALRAQGLDVALAPSGEFDGALVVLPRAKADAQDRVAQATALVGAGPVWIDGQKTDGAESMIRTLRKRGIVVDPVISKAHGKLFRVVGADLSDWRAHPRTLEDGAITVPGVFSADGIDRGSALLAAALPQRMTGTLADLGAGWGYLARSLLDRADLGALHLIEADHAALECARRNVVDPRAVFHWADALTFDLPEKVDHVVTNPPFHNTRAADPDLGRAFIAAAARLLKPHGHLWLVANRHLPYEQTIAQHFAKVTSLSDDSAFKLIHAERPNPKPRFSR